MSRLAKAIGTDCRCEEGLITVRRKVMLKGRSLCVRHGVQRAVLCALALTVVAGAPATAAAAGNAQTNHPYRHGWVPFQVRGHQASTFTPAGAASSNDLRYGGGISNGTSTVGVTTSAARVYLVFWGSQWGSQSVNGSGYNTYSGDPDGLAPDLQAFFKGLGTGGEAWSGVMTQYCQGVSLGTTICSSTSTQHVGYPTGGALAGVWEDTSSAAPAAASAHQIGAEAAAAATHFGNTTQSSNLNTQYVIISPTGTDPDSYQSSGFCAWHDYTGDSALDGGGAVSSPDGMLAFTNLPYIPDAGYSCGAGFVNSPGTLDGVTIVGGHEYAETITDTYPAGGWTDSTGYENGDKCAWISSGQGASQNIVLSTGSFPVQSTWANDYNGGAGGCEISHPIITNGATSNTVTVTNPGNQTTVQNASVNLQIHASDSASGQTLTYSASGLPSGLSIGSSTGLISGTGKTTGSYNVVVTVKDGAGVSGTASFTWTVSPSSGGGGGCTATQLIGNPGFESGATVWSASSSVIGQHGPAEPAHSGSWDAWLDGYGTSHTDTLSQRVAIPSGCTNYTFSFWLHIDTAETTTTSAYDTLKVQVLNSSGAVLATLATFSNLNRVTGYLQHTYSLKAYAGQTLTLKFTGTENFARQTSFVIDDTALNIS
jgi:hypothetical protein